MKSGWALAGLCLLFLAVFFLQRSRSTVLRIESGRPLAERVALETGLTVPEVMSLREIRGPDLSETRLTAEARRFAETRQEKGVDLAILLITDHEDLAEELWQQSGGDPSRASELLESRSEAVLAVRYRDMTRRFASRQTR